MTAILDGDLTILVGGAQLTGWERIELEFSVERYPRHCMIRMSERDPGKLTGVVAQFVPCTVMIGGDLIITGFVDIIEPRYAKDGHWVTLMIRGKCEDLADCSVDVDALAAGTGSWVIKSGTAGAAARLLAAPYNVPVVVNGDDIQLNTLYPIAVPPGATVGQILEELGRVTQRLMYEDEKGQLAITEVGTVRAATALIEGSNIEIGASRLSAGERYSRVVVFAQDRVIDKQGPHISFKQESKDPTVPRNRLLMIVTDLPGPDGKWAQQRADWEIARRYGRSRIIRTTVTGWRMGNGQLWQINQVVSVNCPSLKLNEDMITAQIRFMRDERGTRTELMCMPAAGLQPMPFIFHPSITIDPASSQFQATTGGFT
jgi:prophage tail gpP-like protein